MEGALGRVIRELLEANDEDGNPNYLLRDKGAELVHRYPDAFAAEAAGDEGELLPHGILVVYPVPPELRLDGPPEE
jgi:hypothetical protein